MSVQGEITRLETAKAAIAGAITDKGVDVPADARLDDMAQLVAEIPVPDISGKADKAVPSAANNVALLDAEGNLADSGKALTPAAIGALPADGTAAAATKLATARSIFVDLGSSVMASFDGTASVYPGVSGTLQVLRGGTGVTSVGGTDYTTTRFRGSQLCSADTNPTINGTINWTYA